MDKQLAAAAVQREAARKQAELVAQAMAGSQPGEAPSQPQPAPSADCDPIPDPNASVLVEVAARSQQVDPKLLRRVILQESGFRPCAVSPKGARGMMQLMPAAIEQFQVADALDPKQNVEAGAKYLKQLLDKYKGDVSLALAAYNSGPATVDAAGGVPNIKETRDYVRAIVGATRPAPPQTPTPRPTGN